MAARGSSPTIRRRELGLRLRQLRIDASKKIEDAAEALMCTPSKVSRIETGKRIATPRDIRDLCAFYGVADPDVRDELMRLSREARERSWWKRYSDLGEVTSLIDYQDGASAITEYDSCLVPGLLQTNEYARAAILGLLPRIEEAVLHERVEARMRRQSLLDEDNPPRLWALLDESVLLRDVGGPGVMKGQLEKLLQAARLPQVTIQVVPFRVGAYPSLNSAFSFVEFADIDLSPVIYTEGLSGEFYLEDEGYIARYREAIAYLRANALGPADSLDFIEQVAARRSQPGS